MHIRISRFTTVTMIVAITATLLFSSCAIGFFIPGTTIIGNNIPAEESRSLAGFTDLDISGGARVILSQGSPSFRIRTDSNILPEIESRVSGTTLHVHPRPGTGIRTALGITLEISMPELGTLEGSGATGFEAPDFPARMVRLRLSGASSFTGSGEYSSVDARLSGASRVRLTGTSDTLVARLSGASVFDSLQCPAATVALEAEGASRIYLTATGSLGGELSGASRLEYKGTPAVTSIRSTGGSSVTRIGY